MCVCFPISLSSPQDQYIFLHDSISELVVCGDTQVVTADLRRVMNMLQDVEQEGGVSGYERQYNVSSTRANCVCLKFTIATEETCVRVLLSMHN